MSHQAWHQVWQQTHLGHYQHSNLGPRRSSLGLHRNLVPVKFLCNNNNLWLTHQQISLDDQQPLHHLLHSPVLQIRTKAVHYPCLERPRRYLLPHSHLTHRNFRRPHHRHFHHRRPRHHFFHRHLRPHSHFFPQHQHNLQFHCFHLRRHLHLRHLLP